MSLKIESGDMRKHADWMTHADERVLEYLSENGNHRPAQIADQLGTIGADMGFHRKYVGRRCRTLQARGMLRNLGNGLYQITDLGEQFLDGEIDAGGVADAKTD